MSLHALVPTAFICAPPVGRDWTNADQWVVH